MTHIAFHPHVQHVQGKLDHTEFTNLGFLCSSLWWNLCKRPPLNDTYQTGDGTPNADGTIWWIHMTLSVWSSCTGGRWCDTEEEQWTMFLFPRNVPQLKGLQCGLNTSLHANCCSVCSSSQKNKKVLSFIKKGWDETFENITKDSTLLLWKPWYNHILRSTWKYVYFQSLTMKNIAEATKRSRAQPMCNRSTKYTKVKKVMHFLTLLTTAGDIGSTRKRDSTKSWGLCVFLKQHLLFQQWRDRKVSWIDPWSNPNRHLFSSAVTIFTLPWIQLCARQFILCWLQLLHYKWF